MWNKPWSGNVQILIGALTLLLGAISVRVEAEPGESKQGRALAAVAAAIVTCSSHPCFGESGEEARKELQGSLLTDGYFDYSDFATAYPSAKGLVQGVVEWELESEVKQVDLKIADFRVKPADFLPQLGQALEGCELEWDDEFGEDPQAGENQCDGGATCAWTCSAQGQYSDDILISVYYIPGLLLLEIGP